MPIRLCIVGFLMLWVPALTGQVTVDFTVDQTSGCGSMQVQLTDLSNSTAGNLMSWEWDLGGVQSTLQNPGRVFAEPGTYTVCLTVTDEMGNSASTCKQDLITLYELPLVDFYADEVNGCAPLDVSYTDMSISPNGTITNRIWGLGGASGVVEGGAEVQQVSSMYSVPGSYSVSLIVEDTMGCSNVITRDQYIQVGGIEPLEVTVETQSDCQMPAEVFFQVDNISDNTMYQWDFGNGNVFTGTVPPAQLYGTTGVYSVSISAVDTITLCVDTMWFPDLVNVGIEVLPEASTYSTCLNERIQFQDASTSPEL